MENKAQIQASKFISYVLRHRPEKAGLEPDSAGWVPVADLLAACVAAGHPLRQDDLADLVRTNDKQRYAFSPDGQHIRANQGHSIAVDLGLKPVSPPDILYHGTARSFLKAILKKGLLRGSRHHVHLSADATTASAVGARHGQPVILVVDAQRLHAAGQHFYRSANGVWLTATVPPKYLTELGK